MVTFRIDGHILHLELRGMHKLWALKGKLSVDLAQVRNVRTGQSAASDYAYWLRIPGTHIPGVIRAGTYMAAGKRAFWSVTRPEDALVIELRGARYEAIVVNVQESHHE